MAGKVVSHMTMSLDGYIADPSDGVGELFEWYSSGNISMPSANSDVTFDLDETNVEPFRGLIQNIGVLVSGRRLFDITNGWNDSHPAGVPVVVVTHHPPTDAASKWPKTHFSNTVEAAVAEARLLAGDKDVSLASANVIQQALALGLVDEICVSLAPVLFGEGISYFSHFSRAHIMLDDPIVIQGHRALHLRYRVREQK